MLQIILASHGHLASGFNSALDVLTGSCTIKVFDAFLDEQSLKDIIADNLKSIEAEDTLVMCSDLYGGSVNQTMALFLDRPHTYLIAGVNLAFLLELSLKTEITEEELETLIDESREALRLVKLEEIDSESADAFF